MAYQKQNKKLETQKAELSAQLATAQVSTPQTLRQEVERLRGQVAALTGERNTVQAALAKQQPCPVCPTCPVRPNVVQGHDQPPVIRLTEKAGFRFAPNSATLSPEVVSRVRSEVVPQILDAYKKYGTLLVEVRGHTDEVPMGACSKSNMDVALLRRVWRESSPSLTFCSNVELAMARAAEMVAVLREELPANFVVVALSAGQTITEFGVLSTGRDSGPNPDRRRIEITMTKLLS